MKIAIIDKNNEIRELNYRKDGFDYTEDLIGFGVMPEYDDEINAYRMKESEYNWWKNLIAMQERCDELEEEIDDLDAVEEMKDRCGNTDLEDSIRQYKYLLEEYTEKMNGKRE